MKSLRGPTSEVNFGENQRTGSELENGPVDPLKPDKIGRFNLDLDKNYYNNLVQIKSVTTK